MPILLRVPLYTWVTLLYARLRFDDVFLMLKVYVEIHNCDHE